MLQCTIAVGGTKEANARFLFSSTKSLSTRVFEMRTATGRETLACQDSDIRELKHARV